MPLISVIIPVYNTEQHLNKCLNSVVNQTLKDIEIICINDNSSDNSLNILKEYKEKDKNNRIKIISLKTNKGASHARNIGIKLSTGKYISFIDSDDYIDQNFHHTLYTKALTTGADVVKTGLVKIHGVFDKNGEKSLLNNVIRQNRLSFLKEFYSAIYKKDFLINNNLFFPEGILTFEDPIFSLGVILKVKTLEIIDDINYHYLVRKDGKSRLCNIKMAESFICAAEIFLLTLNAAHIEKCDYIRIINDLIISSFYKRCTSKNINNVEFSYLFKKFQKLLNENLLYKDEFKPMKKKRCFVLKYFDKMQQQTVFRALRKRVINA